MRGRLRQLGTERDRYHRRDGTGLKKTTTQTCSLAGKSKAGAQDRQRVFRDGWSADDDASKSQELLSTAGFNANLLGGGNPYGATKPALVQRTEQHVQTANAVGHSFVSTTNSKTKTVKNRNQWNGINWTPIKDEGGTAMVKEADSLGETTRILNGRSVPKYIHDTWHVNQYKRDNGKHRRSSVTTLSHKYTLPLTVRVEGAGSFEASGQLKGVTTPIQSFGDGSVHAGPNTKIERNAFGMPVVVHDPVVPANGQCVMRYDALGRLLSKDVPARVQARPDMDSVLVVNVQNGDQIDVLGQIFASRQTVKSLENGIALAADWWHHFGPGPDKRLVQVYRSAGQSEEDLFGNLQRADWCQFKFFDRQITVVGADDEALVAPTKSTWGSELSWKWNVTLRNFRFRRKVSISNCRKIVFDGCIFEEGLELSGKCEAIAVNNCVVKKGIDLASPKAGTTAAFAFNVFDLNTARAPVKVVGSNPKQQPGAFGLDLRAYNNVIVKRSPGDRNGQVLNATGRTRAPFNHHIYRADFRSDAAFAAKVAQAMSGQLFAEQGTADTPDLPQGIQPVLWDKGGVVRDWKSPCPGPVNSGDTTHNYD